MDFFQIFQEPTWIPYINDSNTVVRKKYGDVNVVGDKKWNRVLKRKRQSRYIGKC